ncbi:MAG: 2-C-methyl-D-erythritol 2,4-cyclodiphosphate synthase, partial [Deltaproteobacteria bacterium]|nr:2-C-methyl-D-erythritol 2,4-cyclodiphosphate synthase [Deltaproteobacteria bacterium]
TTGVDPDCVNIKATTTEGMGMIGNGEGIGALCVVLIQSKSKQNN